MISKKVVEDKLRQVMDPELGINIVDLGLVYEVLTSKNDVEIIMTLTFPGCPLGNTIREEVNQKIGTIANVGEIKLNITFDPPWDLSKMSPEARAEMGMV